MLKRPNIRPLSASVAFECTFTIINSRPQPAVIVFASNMTKNDHSMRRKTNSR